MSDNRNNELIFNAIDAGSYKSAQALCSKQMKRYPNSSYYYALNNYILLLNGSKEEAIRNSKELMAKIPSDLSTLELLNLIFKKVGLYNESIEVYENACKKYSSLNLIQSWFDLSLKNFDILSLQKSSMALVQKGDNSTNGLKLWCSLNLLIASGLEKLTKNQKYLFPKLGLKMIEDCKPLKNSQEYYIYVSLLMKNGHFQQAADVIKEFLNQERDLELQLILLKSLNDAENWNELFDICDSFLNVHRIDDWNVWSNLIKAASNLGKLDQTLKIIDNFPIASRNRQLAYLELIKHNQQLDHLERYFESYLDIFGTKLCCFPDLKPFLLILESEKFMNILAKQISSRKIEEVLQMQRKPTDNDLILMVNYMKFKFYLHQDKLTNFEFLQENLTYYKATKYLLNVKEKTDYFAGDEFLLIGVQIIIALSKQDEISELFKCIVILEKAVERDVHEYHLRLWLVQLYSALNCYSLARLHYDSLKIKFIQQDTLSHYIFTRISSLQPSAGALKDLTKSQAVYDNSDFETSYFLQKTYEKQSFSKTNGFLEFGLRFSNSLAKYLNYYEMYKINKHNKQTNVNAILDKLRISYKLSKDSSQELQRSLDLDEKLSDNRDFKILWDCSILDSIEVVDKVIKIGPLQTCIYLRTMLSKEFLILGDEQQDNSQIYLQNIEQALKVNNNFTEVELWQLRVIRELAIFVLQNESSSLLKLESLINNFLNQFLSVDNATTLMTWRLNHNFINVYDTFKSIQSFQQVYKKQINKEANKKISDLNKKLIDKLRDNSVLIKAKRSEVTKDLKLTIKNWFLNNPKIDFEITESFIEGIFQSIKESSESSVGILRKL
ncbi:hypothetical protein PACTADRAFT_50835 [Pachysolen tannophilus NRRL Y-2460]|uniref:N-terminal acetyltransferase B complex subunit MDM20 n=1 Tax=Pachysolen tannophilus NRRL Y-2460 TaxID=669874 RepID=A0A1E4TTD2_PACTA|nr:hypothetical protein PACTADRAFT_50835 [Pachysolen tannophilus NRRL Y-2460]